MANRRRLPSLAPFLALGIALTMGESLEAQAGSRLIPSNAVVLTGYGTVGYLYRPSEDAAPSTFSTSFSPIFLFQFQDRILFETELEFDIADGVTETGLEYAQLDMIASDNLMFAAGKFLIPFGVFGDRLHPTWINKFPTPPPIYGHHTSEFGAPPLLPVMSDLGAMAKVAYASSRWHLGLAAYVTQGPEVEAHDEGAEPEAVEGALEIPEISFPGSTGDGNRNKMYGGRVDIALPPWAELNISVLNGDYDETGVLDFTAWNIAAEIRKAGFELRGEYLETRQEIEIEAGFPTFVRSGFYSQASYRRGDWEPVVRFTKTFDDELDGVADSSAAWQTGVGIDYWLGPSVAIMAGYEINRESLRTIDNDRLIIHIAFGF